MFNKELFQKRVGKEVETKSRILHVHALKREKNTDGTNINELKVVST